MVLSIRKSRPVVMMSFNSRKTCFTSDIRVVNLLSSSERPSYSVLYRTTDGEKVNINSPSDDPGCKK